MQPNSEAAELRSVIKKQELEMKELREKLLKMVDIIFQIFPPKATLFTFVFTI